MREIEEQDNEAVNQFMMAEFQAALSRREMHTGSIESLMNIHLTIVSIGIGGLVALGVQPSSGTFLLPIIVLFLLLILGLNIEHRISVHVSNNRWDGYRYRLAEQFFVDQYPNSKIGNYTEWPSKPEKRLTISRGSFARSFVGITASINSLIFAGLIFFVVLEFCTLFLASYVNLHTGLAIIGSIVAAFASWYIQKWNFHRGAKRQGFILQLSSDPGIVRESTNETSRT
ncbi:hypothetical protein QUF58_13120 [Anaerolineales bacterium HSG24]|nr:hypothetical protein [Anaerolineales bacterium HSG24]